MPRDAKGDVCFKGLFADAFPEKPESVKPEDAVTSHFSYAEITALVNRAIYQLEYQAASHRKRGQAERARMKLLKEQLGKAGAKDAAVKEQLKGGGDK